MTYRNGTYIAFHAEGKTDPTASDIKYYRLLKAWHQHDDISFRFVNSHEKVAAVRDSSSKETILRSLRSRLSESKNMVLVIGKTTKNDRDFVPYEIAYAIDRCRIPVIAVYTDVDYVLYPEGLRSFWPAALLTRIDSGVANIIHIGFKQSLIDAAIRQFSVSSLPDGPLVYYTRQYQQQLGVNLPM